MDYNEIVTHVISARFKEGQRSKVQLWVKRRYAAIWALADWPWKLVGPTSLTITAGDNTPTPPSDIGKPRRLYDDDGYPLPLLISESFDDLYLYGQLQGSTGKPQAWKWENGVITVGPVPDAAYTFKLTYDRRVAHRDLNGTVADGTFSLDSDLPIWDNRDFDYALVPGAIATGLKEENDPTWRDLEDEFAQISNDMREFYLPSASTYGNIQFGRDEV
jgi:hypothetical protein